jgi:hypothetical protein
MIEINNSAEESSGKTLLQNKQKYIDNSFSFAYLFIQRTDLTIRSPISAQLVEVQKMADERGYLSGNC